MRYSGSESSRQNLFFCLFVFAFSWPTPEAYGGPMEAVAAGLQQCEIQATSATCTTAHGNARSLTH